ncbi:MAG: DNA/RNA nuclease SfsA [Gammaproteobacteria bacterium]|nr:DNA/RNA nuclease SfsA [Gammaproteobacteria bacterium]
MQFSFPLIEATLIRRYKRFLADVTLTNGKILTVHCANTGAMTGCAAPGSRVWLSRSDNPKRKYPYSWELVETAAGALACINTARANILAYEAIECGTVAELQGYTRIRREVRCGAGRVDLLLEGSGSCCYVEVKNVTLQEEGKEGSGIGLFPDAPTVRGTRQLRDLTTLVEAGQRAMVFFCVQHSGIEEVRPADAVDPLYGKTLRKALTAGVEVVAYKAVLSPQANYLQRKITFKALRI